MQDHLKIALIQSDLIWENPKKNRKHFKEKIESITEVVDFIVLPEMFATGFTMNAAEVAEPTIKLVVIIVKIGKILLVPPNSTPLNLTTVPKLFPTFLSIGIPKKALPDVLISFNLLISY